jgi:hypothetical protein
MRTVPKIGLDARVKSIENSIVTVVYAGPSGNVSKMLGQTDKDLRLKEQANTDNHGQNPFLDVLDPFDVFKSGRF